MLWIAFATDTFVPETMLSIVYPFSVESVDACDVANET